MTLIKQESHLLTCDSCGYEMQIDGAFKTLKGWLTTFSLKKDKVYHYCPDCHIVDENDNVIIRKKEDNNE